MRKKLLGFCIPLLGLSCASMAHAENVYLFSLGAGVAPRYQGSETYRAVFAPGIAADFGNGLFISSTEGAGYKKTFANGMFVSTSLGYDYGRSDSNRTDLPGSAYLKGMGRIPGSVMASFQVGAHVFGESTVSLTLEQPLTNTAHGTSGHFDFKVPVIETAQNEVSLTSSLHAGSERYTQTFFGVTAAQSASSGFRPYTAKGGFDSTTFSIAWNYKITPKWSLHTEAGATHFLGAYGKSPIVQAKNAYTGMMAVVYRY